MCESIKTLEASDASPTLLVREAKGRYRAAAADEIVQSAFALLAERLRSGDAMTTPDLVKDFVRVRLGAMEHEVFAVLFLDAQHRVIAFDPMFRGTLTQTSVYPREVVKESLRWNAAAVVLAHNHPSGTPEPSRADEHLTQALKAALQLVDVRVLDHIVVGAASVVSFAERGLL